MDKIIVRLMVPSIEGEFDVSIPQYISIQELVILLDRCIVDVSNHQFIPTGNERLCSKERNIVFEGSRCLASYEIGNGEHIVLI